MSVNTADDLLVRDENFDFLFKIILIGDSGTGKTCVVQRFRSGTYVERHPNTIGVDFLMKTILIDKKKVKLQIWDTAGIERFRSITQSYYRSADGIILVYDITNRDTFLNIPKWVDEVRKYTTTKVMLILVGNKCDMEYKREVEEIEAKTVCTYLPEVFHVLETSAKDNVNIDAIFFYIASELKSRHENCQLSTENDEIVRLGDSRSLVSGCSSCAFK